MSHRFFHCVELLWNSNLQCTGNCCEKIPVFLVLKGSLEFCNSSFGFWQPFITHRLHEVYLCPKVTLAFGKLLRWLVLCLLIVKKNECTWLSWNANRWLFCLCTQTVIWSQLKCNVLIAVIFGVVAIFLECLVSLVGREYISQVHFTFPAQTRTKRFVLSSFTFFRPSATVSRIGLMESCTCCCHCHGGRSAFTLTKRTCPAMKSIHQFFATCPFFWEYFSTSVCKPCFDVRGACFVLWSFKSLFCFLFADFEAEHGSSGRWRRTFSQTSEERDCHPDPRRDSGKLAPLFRNKIVRSGFVPGWKWERSQKDISL